MGIQAVSVTCSHMVGHRRQRGVTLIELMVAMVLGLLVSAGIIAVFVSTSKSNRVQTQLATLQEQGRFAITRMRDDLRMANAQYCTSTGGLPTQNGNTANLYTDRSLSPISYVKQLNLPDTDPNATWGASGYPTVPTAPYAMPPFMFMRGYECPLTGACSPNDPPQGGTGQIPVPGKAVGKRVIGTSVLTLRYLDGSKGWSIGSDDKVKASTGVITITPDTGEPPLSHFAAGDKAMLADCAQSQVYDVTRADDTFTPTPASPSGNMTLPTVPAQSGSPNAVALKLFDFDKDFQTVTYYLQVVSDDGTAGGVTTGALMRRVNGGPAQELIRGVERLNFDYVVEDANGDSHYLTAAQVADRDGGAIACPNLPDGTATQGCLWRSLKAIEVHMLVDGQRPMATLTDDELAYLYTPDGGTAPTGPGDAAHTVTYKDQGFDRGMLRREFSALISIRNYNP